MVSPPIIAAVNTRRQSAAFSRLSLSPTMFLQASQIAGKSNNDAITSWTNLGSVGGAFTGPGTHTTFQTAVVNGQPTVRSSGAGSALANATAMSSYISGSASTLWCVGRVASAPNSDEPAYLNSAFFSDGTADVRYALTTRSDGTVVAYIYNGGNMEVVGTAAIGSFFSFVMTFDASGPGLTLRINGAQVGNAPSSIAQTGLTFTPHLFSDFSGTKFMTGDIAEIGQCNTVLSPAQIANLEGSLRTDYATW